MIPEETSCDIVVIGSGAAGLSASLAAASRTHAVTLLERADVYGGTTALSGGGVWIPDNDRSSLLGNSDSMEEVLTYLRALALGEPIEKRLIAYATTAKHVATFLERATPLRFAPAPYPDYHPEMAGGKSSGRTLVPYPFNPRRLGGLASSVRQPTVDDLWMEDYVRRKGWWSGGRALVGALLVGCSQVPVRMISRVRARRLIVEGGRVAGVVVERAGKLQTIRASTGVILASGGFEWNPTLCRAFLRGPLQAPLGAPENTGDGLLMAMEVGAALGNMAEAWWTPVVRVPDKHGSLDLMCWRERSLPGSIIVNRAGRRFINEAHNYNDIGRAFHAFDAVRFEYSNLPAWLLFSEAHVRLYGFLARGAGHTPSSTIARDQTLRGLAEQVGIDPDGLMATVERFNLYADRGIDPEFGRGSSAFDRWHGDPRSSGAAACLGPIKEPPFFAVEVALGALGTSGGVRTNEYSEVLNVWGEPISGLWAAGNVIASPTGLAYPGGGTTIGLALTFGYLAGRTAGGAR